MKGRTHEKLDATAGIILTVFLISLHYPVVVFLKFLFGSTLLPLYFSSDNDSPKSRSIQRWGILKIIWKPFINAGHREILHNPIWGPWILCLIPSVPLFMHIYNTGDFTDLWILYGLCVATETHIMCDWISSGTKKIIPKWVQKGVKKIIPKRIQKVL